jgi:DNA-binding CsgD family transcriptional regulator
MATRRKKKSSSPVDQQQTNTYSYIQGTPLRLVRRINPPTAEDLSETGRRNVLAGGRRSTDKFMGGIYAYWKSLSAREQDVTILVCKGLSDAEIASRLYISISTVKSYLQHVFRKVQVRNRRQLMVRFANFNFPRNPSPTDRSIDSY